MSEYREKLRHPNWQRKRLEIMQRDDFTCRGCGSKDRTLNVHHLFYDKTADPWEYPNTSLVTLCDECHESEHEAKYRFEQSLIYTLRSIGAMNDAVLGLASEVTHGVEASDEGARQMTPVEWEAVSCGFSALLRCVQTGGAITEIVARLESEFPRRYPREPTA